MAIVNSQFGNFDFPTLPLEGGREVLEVGAESSREKLVNRSSHPGFRDGQHNATVHPILNLMQAWNIDNGVILCTETATPRMLDGRVHTKEEGSYDSIAIFRRAWSYDLGTAALERLDQLGLLEYERNALESEISKDDFRMAIEQILWEDELAEAEGQDAPFAEIRRIKRDTEARREAIMDRIAKGGKIAARGASLDEVMREVRAQQARSA